MKKPKEIKELLKIYKEYNRQIGQLKGKIDHLKDIQEPIYIKLKEFEYGCKIGDIITDSNNVKWKVERFYLYWLKGYKIKKNGEPSKKCLTIYNKKQKHDLDID